MAEKTEKQYVSNNAQLMSEWDWERNNKLGFDPQTITLGSNKKVWWICKEGHFWAEFIKNRTRRTSGCPYCSNHRVLTGFNDLETEHPEIAEEWNYEKNTILPNVVLSGSNKKYWWRCQRGHEWEASVTNRVYKKTGCPICSRERSISLPEKTLYFYLKDYFPDIQEQARFYWLAPREIDIFIPSLNLGIEYDGQYWHTDVDSDKEKENLCKQHEIDLIRIREPKCKTYSGFCKCIQTDNPKKKDFLKKALIELFDYINTAYHLNIELDYNFDRDFIKIQELVVSYEKSNSLLAKSPEIAKEWNYNKNGSLTPDLFPNSSNRSVWWKCKNGHEWIAAICDRTGKSKHGCPFCGNKRVLKGYNDLSTVYPQIASEWHYEKNDFSPDEVLYGSPKKVWWKCQKGHIWQATIVNRTRSNLGCPVCSNHKVLPGFNDLESNYPDIVTEWDYEKNSSLSPTHISLHYDNKVWWRCTKGHSYEATVFDRVKRNRGCPYCSSNKVLPGFNDLETLFPEVAKTWNHTKNGGVLPAQIAAHSNKTFWWTCEQGHEWETTANNRVKGKGCPYCHKEQQGKRRINMYDVNTFTFIATFDSVRAVCEYLDLDYTKMRGVISSVCRRNQKTLMHKYILRNADDDEFSTK